MHGDRSAPLRQIAFESAEHSEQHAPSLAQPPPLFPIFASSTSNVAPMESDHHAALSSSEDYSQLSDDQLRSAIRFAEKRVRGVEEDHVALLRAYHEEISAMRRHLFDRVLGRLIAVSGPPTRAQSRTLQRAIEKHGLLPNQVAILIRATTRGRTDRLDALTGIEAMALRLRLERDA